MGRICLCTQKLLRRRSRRKQYHHKTASDCAANDPKFVNFPINDVALTDYIYQDAWDFHVQAGSPVLAGAYDGTDTKMAPYFGTEGLQVNGQTYTSPKVEARFGAYGTK